MSDDFVEVRKESLKTYAMIRQKTSRAYVIKHAAERINEEISKGRTDRIDWLVKLILAANKPFMELHNLVQQHEVGAESPDQEIARLLGVQHIDFVRYEEKENR